MLGRYFSFQMFPIGLPEVAKNFSHILNSEEAFSEGELLASRARDAREKDADKGLEGLLKFGGFPEPLLKGSEKFHRRWQRDYKTLLTKEDVRDLSRISDIKGLETLVEILPTKVGSRLSIPSISEDLGRNYDTIETWLNVLEGLYLIFSLRPWHRRITRAIKKEMKIYFFDWSLLSDAGNRFENLIAVSLLRMVSRFNETGIGNFELRYIRDRENREVDFVLVRGNEPVALFEAKEGGSTIDKSGRYFGERLNVPSFQVVHKSEKVEEFPGRCFIIPASDFLMLVG